jgi:hypothetical protein
MLSFRSCKDLIILAYVNILLSKKVKMLLPLNYKAPYTLSKRKYNLRTNMYLLSFIILVFSIKIVGSSFKDIN